MRVFYFLFIFIGISIFFYSSQVHAFTISPTKYLITADPGQQQIVRVMVKNDEKIDRDFIVFVRGIKQENSGAFFLQEGSDIAESWVAPESKHVSLEPGQQAILKFNISVPRTALPGAHHLGLAVETTDSNGQSKAINGRLFSILSLQIAGAVQESLAIEQFTAPGLVWQRDWDLHLLLKSAGNINMPVRGSLIITGWGQQIWTEEWKMGNDILAGTWRSLDKIITAPVVWPGKYEVKATILYGHTGREVVVVNNIWYWPWWSGLLALLLVLGGGYLYSKKRT